MKMKNQKKKLPHSAGLAFQSEARHYWSRPKTNMARVTLSGGTARCTQRAVTTRVARLAGGREDARFLVEHRWRGVGASSNTSSEGRVWVGGATTRWQNELDPAASVWLRWPAATERVPCSTRESKGRRMVPQNGKTPSAGGAHRRGGRGSGGSGGRIGPEVGGEERRCAWPYRGGSDTGVKRGRWSTVVAFITARWGGGQAEEGTMRWPRVCVWGGGVVPDLTGRRRVTGNVPTTMHGHTVAAE
jgi:hypothetical protein